jgi:hypothetical protein
VTASLPSVLALPLSEAERALREAGAGVVEVQVTGPPGAPRLAGPWRVVRQRGERWGVRLVAAASVPPPYRVEEGRLPRQPKNTNR